MPLMMLQVGEAALISEIRCAKNSRVRLAEMGLNVGTLVRIVNRNSSGVVLALKESRLALQSGMAQQIQVNIK